MLQVVILNELYYQGKQYCKKPQNREYFFLVISCCCNKTLTGSLKNDFYWHNQWYLKHCYGTLWTKMKVKTITNCIEKTPAIKVLSATWTKTELIELISPKAELVCKWICQCVFLCVYLSTLPWEKVYIFFLHPSLKPLVDQLKFGAVFWPKSQH